MPRLPQPGADAGSWGTILNDFLTQAHNVDGSLKDNSVPVAAIADATITEAKLSSGAQSKLNAVAPVASVAGKTGAVSLVKADVGLANVDNTSDATKNSATATLTNKTLQSPNIDKLANLVIQLTSRVMATAQYSTSTASGITMVVVGARLHHSLTPQRHSQIQILSPIPMGVSPVATGR